MRCYQADRPPPRRGSNVIPVGSRAVATLERLNTAALREMVRTVRDSVREHAHGSNRPNVAARAAGRYAGVVDAGSTGFLLLLDSVLYVVDGEPPPVAVPGELDVSEQRYEVMYLLDLADERIREFKAHWGAIGDSIVVVGGNGLWNCHMHTNEIGAAVEVALDLGGRPTSIRVNELFEEVDEEHERRQAELVSTALAAPVAEELPAVTTAVVAVCCGSGLVELFAQLGVQGVVTGGRTMSPSTAELLETVQRVNADQVVVLPNDNNIIPVAEQLDALTHKTVIVVPTRSMPEALAALVGYDADATAAVNVTEMTEAAGSVVSGEVTRAVRDSTSGVGAIVEGDWIGLVRGDGIVAVASSAEGAAMALLDVIVGESTELVTMVTGHDADDVVTDQIVGWLGDHCGDVHVDVHHGGQSLSPYLFGVE